MRPPLNNRPQARRDIGLNQNQVQALESPQPKRDMRPVNRDQIQAFQDGLKPMMGHLGGGLGDSIGNPASEPCMVLSASSTVDALAEDPLTGNLWVANGDNVDEMEQRGAFWYRVNTVVIGAPVTSLSVYAKRLIVSTATQTIYITSGSSTVIAGASNDVFVWSTMSDSDPNWARMVVADYVTEDGPFPKDFAVTCTDTSVTVWDVSGVPAVYMIFDVGGGLMLTGGIPSSLAYREAWLMVGSNNALRIIDFAGDRSLTADLVRYAIRTNMTIAERNTPLTFEWENVSDGVIVATPVNDVAARLLQGAPRRSGTNLRVPDWAIGTDGGVSHARSDGVIWDITGFSAPNTYIDMTRDGRLLANDGQNLAYTYGPLENDEVAGVNFLSRYYGTDNMGTEPDAPKILGSDWVGVGDLAYGDAQGLTVIAEATPYVNGAAGHITSTYNTGPMVNVTGAYLCGSVV